MTITHAFVNPKADGADTTITRPSDWNAAHVTPTDAIVKNNFSATTNPAVTDDSGDGYSVGSRWINTSTDKEYVCTDASVGAANWVLRSGGVVASGYIASVSADADLVQYWPCNEAAAAASCADVLGGTALTVMSDAATGGPPLQQDWGSGGSVGIWSVSQRLERAAITWPSAWTIEAWVFLPTIITDVMLLGQWDGNGAMIYGIDADSIRIYSNGTNVTWDAPSVDAVRGIHHMALTHDGTTQRFFWDGVEKVNQTASPPTGASGTAFRAGAYSGGAGGTLGYLISDIALYDVAKSGAYLLAHYQLGS